MGWIGFLGWEPIQRRRRGPFVESFRIRIPRLRQERPFLGPLLTKLDRSKKSRFYKRAAPNGAFTDFHLPAQADCAAPPGGFRFNAKKNRAVAGAASSVRD